MPVPKRKTSRSRRDMRSANKIIKFGTITSCQICQEAISPHQVCQKCGHYKGVKILRTKTDRMYDRGQRKQAEKPQENTLNKTSKLQATNKKDTTENT